MSSSVTGRHLAAFALVLLVVSGLAGCSEPNEFVPPPPPSATVARPLRQVVVTFTELPGRTAATQTVAVRARVPGLLKSVEFEEGRLVAEGDLLYLIEPEQYEARLMAARARQQEAEAALGRLEFEFQRIEKLYKEGNAAEVEFVTAEADSKRARAMLLSAEAEVVQAELDLGYTRIVAPISGRANRTEVDAGNLVGQGEQTLLTTIVPWDPIHVYANVDERRVLDFRRRVSSGTSREHVPVHLRLADGSDYPLPGVVDYVDNQVDLATGTVRVRALFANPDELLVPGLFVRARIPSEPIESILVPDSAIQRDLAGYFVYHLDAKDQVQRADVEVGPRSEDYRSILSGLSGEERVVVKGIQRVRPGMPVSAEQVELPPVALPGADVPGDDREGSAVPAGS